jgi:hypothetical protein
VFDPFRVTGFGAAWGSLIVCRHHLDDEEKGSLHAGINKQLEDYPN